MRIRGSFSHADFNHKEISIKEDARKLKNTRLSALHHQWKESWTEEHGTCSMQGIIKLFYLCFQAVSKQKIQVREQQRVCFFPHRCGNTDDTGAGLLLYLLGRNQYKTHCNYSINQLPAQPLVLLHIVTYCKGLTLQT